MRIPLLFAASFALVLWSAHREPFFTWTGVDAALSLGAGLGLLGLWLREAAGVARGRRGADRLARLGAIALVLGYLVQVPWGFLHDLVS